MNRLGWQSIARLGWLAGAALMCGLLVRGGFTASLVSAATRSARATLRPGEVLDEPRSYLLRTARVEGEVGRVLGARAFALQSPMVRQGLLVVLSDRAAEAPAAGRRVEVEGTVRFLSRAEAGRLQRDLGLPMDPGDLLADFGDHPYVLAPDVKGRSAH